jgi:hypothetical protein
MVFSACAVSLATLTSVSGMEIIPSGRTTTSGPKPPLPPPRLEGRRLRRFDSSETPRFGTAGFTMLAGSGSAPLTLLGSNLPVRRCTFRHRRRESGAVSSRRNRRSTVQRS